MVHLIGDIHGDITQIMKENLIKDGISISKNDVVIVLGDFGVMFKDIEQHRLALDCISKLDYYVAFIDGNHENFDYLNSLPIVTKWGNKVHKLNNRCFHLMRGNIYKIEGNRYLCFGGAKSIDRDYRVLGESYWLEEEPSSSDVKRLSKSFGDIDSVDFVLTHTCSNATLHKMKRIKPFNDSCLTRDVLDRIEEKLPSRVLWFYGHFHVDEVVDEQHICLTNETVYSIDRDLSVTKYEHLFNFDTFRFFDYISLQRVNQMFNSISNSNIEEVRRLYNSEE